MGSTRSEPSIGPYVFTWYDDPAALVRPWDPRGPAVADRLVALIGDAFPVGTVEHIGSTAIPGCDGKGVIDLMLLYPDGALGPARDAIDRLGFQRFDAPGAFTDERPVRVGSVAHDGDRFRVHVHIIARDDPEVARQRHFRDTLRANPALVMAYVADKRRIAAGGGIVGGPQYATAKGAFIASVNGTAGAGDASDSPVVDRDQGDNSGGRSRPAQG